MKGGRESGADEKFFMLRVTTTYVVASSVNASCEGVGRFGSVGNGSGSSHSGAIISLPFQLSRKPQVPLVLKSLK